jgi:hypothetical protein
MKLRIGSLSDNRIVWAFPYPDYLQLPESRQPPVEAGDAQASKVLRHGIAGLLVYCRGSGLEPVHAHLQDVDGPYADWLATRPAGNSTAMRVYARKFIEAAGNKTGVADPLPETPALSTAANGSTHR